MWSQQTFYLRQGGYVSTLVRDECMKFGADPNKNLDLVNFNQSRTFYLLLGSVFFTVSQPEYFGGKLNKGIQFSPAGETPPPPSAHRTPVVTPATP